MRYTKVYRTVLHDARPSAVYCVYSTWNMHCNAHGHTAAGGPVRFGHRQRAPSLAGSATTTLLTKL